MAVFTSDCRYGQSGQLMVPISPGGKGSSQNSLKAPGEGCWPIPMEIRPHVGTALAAGAADEARLGRQPELGLAVESINVRAG